MQIEIATLFPEMCEAVLSESIIGRARAAGHISVRCWNIREYTLDKHRRVDDVPYGGGRGMVMQADPIYRCYDAVQQDIGAKPKLCYLIHNISRFTRYRSSNVARHCHCYYYN